MGITAENLAEKYNITREDVDKFALRSQLNWKAAHENGNFKGNLNFILKKKGLHQYWFFFFSFFIAEMAPVSLEIKKKPVSFDTDEHPRVQTTMEMLAKVWHN